MLHSLFERLPGVSEPDRLGLALQWLSRQGIADAVQQEIAEAACSVIGNPDHADLFGETSLAEAPIAATLPDGRVIAGAVDRLCIDPKVIKVVDFKTGRNVPTDIEHVPRSHRSQMEAYVQALQVIFPGRRVEASLLYTSGPKLIVLPG